MLKKKKLLIKKKYYGKKLPKRKLIIKKPTIWQTALFLKIMDKRIPNIAPKT